MPRYSERPATRECPSTAIAHRHFLVNELTTMNSTFDPLALPVTSLPRTSTLASRGHSARKVLSALLGVGATLLAGCDSKSPAPNSNTAAGTVLTDPATGNHFVVDANQRGQGDRIKLLSASWGRLVDVYDASGALQFKDFVMGDGIASDAVDFKLDQNEITENETLTILHAAGSAEYDNAFAQLERHLQPVIKNGAFVLPTATLTALPRNATLVLNFDDLLDSSLITAKNVAVLTGYPPVVPFEARVIADPSHGDLFDADGDGSAEFHTTRVLVDMTVTEFEAQQSNPPLPVNVLGLPEAHVVNQANLVVRIPTLSSAAIGQLSVLANLSGSGMNFPSNAPNDPQSATMDVVRALRSSSADLLDPNHGFLADMSVPRLVGVQAVNLLLVTPTGGVNYRISASFDAPTCAPRPKIGDVIRVSDTVIGVVTQNGSAPAGGIISDVPVRLEIGNSTTFVPGPAQYLMKLDPTLGVPPACFVRIAPTPTSQPSQGVSPNSTLTVRFSKPMDPKSVSAFETFGVTRVTNVVPTIKLGNTIVGYASPSVDLKQFTFTPQVPFEHNPAQFPTGEEYLLTLAGGPNGVTDLSGKALKDALPPFNFRLDPAAAAVGSRGFAFKFNSADEDGNGAPELRGQFLYDLSKGIIRPRSVARFSAVADASQSVIGLMTPFTAPIQTPLSNLGSKLMSVYRYHDLGFGLVDDPTLNLDIEGLAWAPFAGVHVDTYSQFRMAFCHSKFLPDEVLNAISLLPQHPNSGLVKTFDSNQLDPISDPLKIVHPKNRGYDVQPVDAFVSSTGTLMMPYPLNRNVPTELITRYTFRDTGLLAVGGPNGSGVETGINIFAGVPWVKLYTTGKVPSIGLPLLMEFRCYPDAQAFGLNGFKVNLALNSSARPAFRAFSTGGVLANGSLLKIDPDNEPNAKGGIVNGNPTGFGSEIDPVFYLGQADFVVRVNRIHTIWLDTFQFTAQYQTPVVEPQAALQPAGTQVLVALRGALNVTNGTAPIGGVVPRNNATAYDPYGDPRAAVVFLPPSAPFTVVFPVGPGGLPDNTWKTNPSLLNNSRFVQARITLISNPSTLLWPEITAMGFSLMY